MSINLKSQMFVVLEVARESLLEFGSLPPVIILYGKDEGHIIVDTKSKTAKQTERRIRKLTKKFRGEAVCLAFTAFCAAYDKSLCRQGILPEYHSEQNEVLAVAGRDQNKSLLLVQSFSGTEGSIIFEEPLLVSPEKSLLSHCKLY